MAFLNSLGALSQGTTATSTATSTNVYSQQLGNYNQYQYDQSVMNQLQNAFAYGQGIAAISPEKIFKKAKGLLAELREEIDAWHGNILRV